MDAEITKKILSPDLYTKEQARDMVYKAFLAGARLAMPKFEINDIESFISEFEPIGKPQFKCTVKDDCEGSVFAVLCVDHYNNLIKNSTTPLP